MVDNLYKGLNLILVRCQLQTQGLHDLNQDIKILILRLFPGI